MDSLANLIETFATNELVKLAIPMAVGALIIIGLGFLLGFQRVVDWCKSHILYIVAGLSARIRTCSAVTSNRR